MTEPPTTPDEQLRYPIGRRVHKPQLTAEERQEAIGRVETLPSRLTAVTHGLSEAQLDTPYRPSGWTGRQVVHHLADAHGNFYCRFRIAVTTEGATIAPFDEAAWANLSDAIAAPVDQSIRMLDGLHRRTVFLLRSLQEADFERTFTHTRYGVMRIDALLWTMAWHGDHHVAHLTRLLKPEVRRDVG